MPDIDKNKYLKKDKDKTIVNEVLQSKQYFEDQSQKKRTEWQDVWKLWVQDDTGVNPFQSNKRLPYAKRAVNTLAAFLVAKEPTFRGIPIGDDDELKAQFMTALIQYQAKQKDMLDLKRKAKIAVKSATLFGNAFFKVTWKTILSKDKKPIFDDPVLENVHVMDLYADSLIGTVQGQRRIIQSFVLPIEEVRANKEYKVPKDLQPTFTDTSLSQYDSASLDVYDLNPSPASNYANGKVQLLEDWTKDWVTTIADPYGTPVVLRRIPNPYGFLPFVKVDYELEPVPNRFYCSGAIGPNVKVNKAMDELVNNIIDNIRIIVNPMYKRRAGSNIDPRQLVSRPAGWIDVDEMSDLEQFITQDTTGSGFKLLQYLEAKWQEGTQVTSQRMGIGGSADTATEADIQDKNANITTNSVKDNFEDALAEVGTMVAKLNVMNMDRDASVRIFDVDLINKLNKGITEQVLTPEQIQEVQEQGTLAGLRLKPEEVQEAISTGKLEGLDLTPERIDKIKKFGQLIKVGKDHINVKTDIQVIADSMLNPNSDVIRKQLMDLVNIFKTLPGVQMDAKEIAKTMGDLSQVPNVQKFIMSSAPQMQPGMGMPPGIGMPGNPPGPMPGTVPPQVGQLNSTQAIRQSIQSNARRV